MLLICIVLVELQFGLSSTIQYWTTTYATDKVPDYWNHGPIYLPELPNKNKESIFPAWITRTTSKVTNKKVTDHDVSTRMNIDNFFPGEKSSLQTMTDDPTTAAIPASDQEVDALSTFIISHGFEPKHTERIMTRGPTLNNPNFTRPEFETSFDDDPRPLYSKITEESTFILPTARPEKVRITRAEYETPLDDDPYPISTVLIKSYTNNKPFITTITPKASEYETNIDLKHFSTSIMEHTSSPEYTHDFKLAKTGQIEWSIKALDSEVAKTDIMEWSTIEKSLSIKPYEIRAIDREVTSDPFSVFIRKMLIVLSMKKAEDLPLLTSQFNDYISMLLTGGQLGKMGLYINSYIAQRMLILYNVPVQELIDFLNTLQKKIGDRHNQLPKDINDILDYMDDTYDEAEEEAMQAVLHETTLFPNTKNKNKIAQGFVDYIFLKPMQRIMDTARGNVLFDMMTEAIKKRDSYRYTTYSGPYRKRANFRKTPSYQPESAEMNNESDKMLRRNKTYRKKQNKYNEYDQSLKIQKSSDMIIVNDSDKKVNHTENANKHNKIMNHRNYKARNARLQQGSSYAKRVIEKHDNTRGIWGDTETPTYLSISQHRSTKGYAKLRHNTPSHKASLEETTESSNIEMELKAKIYDTIRRMNLGNNNASEKLEDGLPLNHHVGQFQQY